MMAVTTYTLPNGTTVTRTALTVAEIQGILYSLTLQMFGTMPSPADQPDPPDNPVRIEWQTTGSPDWSITDDMTFLHAVPDPLPQYLIRNLFSTPTQTGANQTQWYQRRWTASWTLYGPNATDRATLLHSLLLSEFARGLLATSGLGLNPTFDLPRRVPELFGNQWWERADLSASFLEVVSFAESTGTVAVVPLVFNGVTTDVSA